MITAGKPAERGPNHSIVRINWNAQHFVMVHGRTKPAKVSINYNPGPNYRSRPALCGSVLTGVLKVTGQPQSGICVDTTALAHDVSDLRDRHAQVQSQLVHAEAQRLHEFLVQNLASIHWVQVLPHVLS